MASTRVFQVEPKQESYSAAKEVSMHYPCNGISLGPNVRVKQHKSGWIDVSAARKKANANSRKDITRRPRQHPAGRVGNGLDIAKMVLFLLNKENSFINGQNFVVDGGIDRK